MSNLKIPKREVILQAMYAMKQSGVMPYPEVFESILDRVYECVYQECLYNIRNKTVSQYSDQYTDITSDGGMDPRR